MVAGAVGWDDVRNCTSGRGGRQSGGMSCLLFEDNLELAAFSEFAADGDLGIESVAEVFDDGKSKPGASAFAGAITFDAVKAFEDAINEGFGDALAGVFDGDGGAVWGLVQEDGDGAVWGRMFNGVIEEVIEDCAECLLVGVQLQLRGAIQ